MSALVIAFRNPKPTTRRMSRVLDRIQRKFNEIYDINPELASVIERAMDETIRLCKQRTGNVGKSVITINRDDREGA